MLDIIRSNAQSFGVKLAFGIIILVFVFWGIGSITDTGSINVVGMVNDVPITFQQYERAYRNAEEQSSTGGRSLSAAEKKALGHQVFSGLVTDELLAQEAAANHIAVSPYELRLYVDQIPAFRGSDGKFDPETYRNVLSQQRQTPVQFEDAVRRDLLRSKMVAFAVGGSWTDPDEARSRFDYLRQRRSVEYIHISAADAATLASPDEAACTAWYESHKENYAIPRKVDVEYIAVDPLKIVDPESVADDEARAWFERNRETFVEPKTVEVSHILVPVAPDADAGAVKKAEESVVAIQAELASGKGFAEVADAHNPAQAAGKGGKIGWIRPGLTVPEFEAAAYATPKGSVSAPVRSPYGFHLILVEDVKEGSSKSYEDVQGEVKKSLAQVKGTEQISDVLDGLLEDNILGKPMDSIAASRRMELAQTGLVSEEELVKALSIKKEDAAAIMQTGAGHSVDTPVEAGNHYLIVRVADSKPASYKPFEEVREDVVAGIRAESGVDAGRGTLEALLKEMAGGEVPAQWKDRLKASEPFSRGESLAPFEPQRDLAEAIFADTTGKWLPTVYQVADAAGQGVLVCRVKAVLPPDAQEWEQFSGIMGQLTARERTDGLYQAFMKGLVDRSTVRVLNQEAIDRTNM